MKDALNDIMVNLDRLFNDIDWKDAEQIGDALAGLLQQYVATHSTLEDAFYLKKATLWLIEICTARARQDTTLQSYPRAVGKVLDDAYFSLSTSKVDGEFSVESSDRDLVHALNQPNFKNILQAIDDKTEEQGDPSGQIIV